MPWAFGFDPRQEEHAVATRFLSDEFQASQIVQGPSDIRKQSFQETGSVGLPGMVVDYDSLARGALLDVSKSGAFTERVPGPTVSFERSYDFVRGQIL